MKSLRRVLPVCACLGLLGGATALLAQETRPAEVTPPPAEVTPPPAETKAPPKDIILKGDAKCTSCHDETDDYPVLAIGKTRHGVTADSRTPTCTSCHGDSETHVNVPKGTKERPKVERAFGKSSTLPVTERIQACLTCHQGGKRIHWAMGAHATNDVSCTSCHQIHTTNDRVRDKRAQAEVCFACHKEQRVQISRPSRHPVLEGKVACSDCHNSHGSAGEKLLVRDSVVDTCYQCHAEKRGPFVRSHQPVQENCMNCHHPHGTINENLLIARSPFLCQQCHEPTSHRGKFPSITGTGTTINAAGRGCVNCHTNIHGTNNPANISNERTFRR
jgi:DmsE family decaheme c-type cytochrome